MAAFENLRMEGQTEELKRQMAALAEELVADIAARDPDHSQELLSVFVSQLFLAAAEQSRREDRLQRQAKGIAAAKARGVRFGRERKPLPENFYEAVEAWRSKKLTVKEAAELCGMAKSTFYGAAQRMEP